MRGGVHVRECELGFTRISVASLGTRGPSFTLKESYCVWVDLEGEVKSPCAQSEQSAQ